MAITEDTGTAERVHFPFHVDEPFRTLDRWLRIDVDEGGVDLVDDELTIRFGPWSVATPLENVEDARVTGPYTVLKVIGPPRLSLRDRGLTFATSTASGVCIRFRHAVPGILPAALPVPWLRHAAVTVTVERPAVLAELLSAHRSDVGHRDPEVTVHDLQAEAGDDLTGLSASELRERAKVLGLPGTSKLRKAELIDLLTSPPAA